MPIWPMREKKLMQSYKNSPMRQNENYTPTTAYAKQSELNFLDACTMEVHYTYLPMDQMALPICRRVAA